MSVNASRPCATYPEGLSGRSCLCNDAVTCNTLTAAGLASLSITRLYDMSFLTSSSTNIRGYSVISEMARVASWIVSEIIPDTQRRADDRVTRWSIGTRLQQHHHHQQQQPTTTLWRHLHRRRLSGPSRSATCTTKRLATVARLLASYRFRLLQLARS